MTPHDILSVFRLFADGMIAPLIFTLWQSTIKIAKLEAHMIDLRATIDRLNKTIEDNLR